MQWDVLCLRHDCVWFLQISEYFSPVLGLLAA
jgi:hypothetical protein